MPNARTGHNISQDFRFLYYLARCAAFSMSALASGEILSDGEDAQAISVTKVVPKAASAKKPSIKGKVAAKSGKKAAATKQKKVAKVPDDSEPPAAGSPQSPGPSEASLEEGANPKSKTKSAPKKAMKRPGSCAGSAQVAKKPAVKLPNPPGEVKVKKYPYTKKGVWAISVNGKEYV